MEHFETAYWVIQILGKRWNSNFLKAKARLDHEWSAQGQVRKKRKIYVLDVLFEEDTDLAGMN